jgi:hypothetical protein
VFGLFFVCCFVVLVTVWDTLVVSVGGLLRGCVACLRLVVVECCLRVGLVVEVNVCGDLCGYFGSKFAL